MTWWWRDRICKTRRRFSGRQRWFGGRIAMASVTFRK